MLCVVPLSPQMGLMWRLSGSMYEKSLTGPRFCVAMWSASLLCFSAVTVIPVLEVDERAEKGWRMEAEGWAEDWPVPWSL